MDTDLFVVSFDADDQQLKEFLKQNKDEYDFSELHPNRVFYYATNENVFGKMKIETSAVLMLDSFKASRSKFYSYSYANPNGFIQKAKQKRAQHAPHYKDCIYVFISFWNNTFHKLFNTVNVTSNLALRNKQTSFESF